MNSNENKNRLLGDYSWYSNLVVCATVYGMVQNAEYHPLKLDCGAHTQANKQTHNRHPNGTLLLLLLSSSFDEESYRHRTIELKLNIAVPYVSLALFGFRFNSLYHCFHVIWFHFDFGFGFWSLLLLLLLLFSSSLQRLQLPLWRHHFRHYRSYLFRMIADRVCSFVVLFPFPVKRQKIYGHNSKLSFAHRKTTTTTKWKVL